VKNINPNSIKQHIPVHLTSTRSAKHDVSINVHDGKIIP
jgi:hypothetical protein